MEGTSGMPKKGANQDSATSKGQSYNFLLRQASSLGPLILHAVGTGLAGNDATLMQHFLGAECQVSLHSSHQ